MLTGFSARGWSLTKQLVLLQVCVVVLIVGIEATADLYQGPDSPVTGTSHGLLALVVLSEVALTVGIAGSLLIADRVRRQTFGLEPAQIARQYQQHDAMLHAIGDGLLITTQDGTLSLANDEARRLLGLPEDCEGRSMAGLLRASGVAELLSGDERVDNRLYGAAGRMLLINRRNVAVDGRRVGTVTTLRDRTELQAALRELDTIRTLLDALRAQAHESANRIQTLVGLVELGRYDDVLAMGARAAEISEQDADRLLEGIGDIALVALILGKAAQAAERGVEIQVTDRSGIQAGVLPTGLLVTIVGNLLDNAVDAAAESVSGRVELDLGPQPDGSLTIRVHDNGRGVPPEHAADIFEPGWSTKPATTAAGRGTGLALVRQVAGRAGGTAVALPGEGATFEVRLPARVAGGEPGRS